MGEREIQQLKKFLALLRIASSESDKLNQNANHPKELFLKKVDAMAPFTVFTQKVFDRLKITYIKKYPHVDEKNLNIILTANVKYENYPYNSARKDLIMLVEGAIFYLKKNFDLEAEGNVFLPDQDFSFISNLKLKEIIESDYRELYSCFIAKAFKASMILSGGLIEAILLDKLSDSKNLQLAINSKKAPSNSLDKWGLFDLIEVSVDLKFVSGIEKLGHGVRDFRNLVHAGKQLQNNLQVKPEEARIALEVVNIIIREFQ